MEGPIRMNQDHRLAKSISSPTASPWTASNMYDDDDDDVYDEAPLDMCRTNLDITTSIFEPAAGIATCILEFLRSHCLLS